MTETESVIEVGVSQWDITKHDGKVTVLNTVTGNHRTFKISTVHKEGHALEGKRIVALLAGPNNTLDYEGFAFVAENGSVRVWSKKRGDIKDGRYVETEWEKFADLLTRPHYWSERGVEYMASLACRRCGRPLTHPESIASGIGPICEGR